MACAAMFAVSLLAALVLRAPPASAQQLPFRHYNVADGLAHSRINCIYTDTKGYLWFGTLEGLSRFDGHRFTSFGTRDGLGHPQINTIVEDRQGRLWIGTFSGGVARLDEDPQPAISLNTLWCETNHGLYRAAVSPSGVPKFEVAVSYGPQWRLNNNMGGAFADRQGNLWFAGVEGLIQIVAGRVIRHPLPDSVSTVNFGITLDQQDRLLVSWREGVFEFIAPTGANSPGRHGQWKRMPWALAPGQEFRSLLRDSKGSLWVGTNQGLINYEEGRQTVYTTARGLSNDHIFALGEDRQGGLWIGTFAGGVCKLSDEMIVNFTRAEGLPDQNVLTTIEAHDGRIYATTELGGTVEIVGGEARQIPGSPLPLFNNLWRHHITQDRRGDWWVAKRLALFRFTGPGLQFKRGRKFTAADGIPEIDRSLVYVDLAGKVWVRVAGHLYQLDPELKGQRAVDRLSMHVSRMLSDRSGSLWLASSQSELRRWTGEKTLVFAPTEGLPDTSVWAFFQDSRGWLWIGLRYKGVSMTRDPAAEHPRFVNYSTADGLASDTVWSITEDDFGRIYLGTWRGLDRLDPATGRIRHFTTADGLAGDHINHCMKDRQGNIWIATNGGLSKLNPRAERLPQHLPPIYLSRVNVAGEDLSLLERGVVKLPELTLEASRNNLLIEYVALNFQNKQDLRYQYKLEGVDADWGPPTEQLSVNYARLAPGSYRFLVRAVNPDGIVSPAPATFEFRILPPVWQRWWFVALAAMSLGLAAYSIYRSHLARLLALERVRTRIATDLHDDIGANLSLIAMRSEVVRRQAGRDDSRITEHLAAVASLSRELVDSISDIVWAVNPQRDNLRDLARRMRRFADDICGTRDIALDFRAPDLDRDVKLGADVRREVFLVFKESLNNIVRHSRCTEGQVEFRIEDGWLLLQVSDNGDGFDPAQADGGNGLSNMARRAKKLGGELDVISHPGEGATVRLRAPLRHQR